MEDDLLWGTMVMTWVIVATIPYLYVSVLSLVGQEAPANQLIDRFGVPWLLTFGGLIALWGLEAHAHFAILYSVVVSMAAIGWAIWGLTQKRKKKVLAISPSQSEEMLGDEHMLLSKTQRYILIAVAALVGVILIAQIGEEGLRDSPWMVGLLVIACLLLLAFAPKRK